MTITVVYVFPTVGGGYFDSACRFVNSYNANPPGAEHRLIVVSNGGPPSFEMRCVIDQLNHPVEIFTHDNSGYDIGAYEAVARAFPCQMMVFLGNTTYFKGAGWLARMAEAFQRHGESSLYGVMGNNGDMRVNVQPHIRTTGFWLAPMMLNMYPLRVTQPGQRYAFEHGPLCLTSWFRSHGHKVLVVTWTGEYEWPAWDGIPNGFHQGDQSALLCGDRISEPPFYHTP